MSIARTSALALLILLAGGPAKVAALQSDKEQPVYIEADSVEIDDRNGVSKYLGKVKLSQGSMVLQADTITVHSPERKIRTVVAEGSPVRYQQRLDRGNAEVHGEAGTIEFDARSGILKLKDDAKLSRNGSVFTGSYIEYDSTKDVVQASTLIGTDNRVRVILQPESSKPAEKEAPSETGKKKNQ